MTTYIPRRRLLQGAAAAGLLPLAGQVFAADKQARFTIGPKDFLLDGKPLQIRCGEMHFARVPREYWKHRLQAIKAMGLNTVCAYLFWNYHEWREGKFDWAGQRDAAEFCRIAQAEGLWIILRPGPYACAEWEMGGLPWWLLKSPGDAFLRTRADAFMKPAQRYLREVGRVLGPLQITQGGPILMVQVENEYGFFGEDLAYMRAMRQALLDAKFDVPLFQCNPTNAVAKAHIPELFDVVNFGSDPAAGFKELAKVQQGPQMCGEYYSGWFDTWGNPHRRGAATKAVADIQEMLKAGGSFSLYMAHGGTSFGLWGGCDRPFRPDTSSYDYDAPIGESGSMGEKFNAYRDGIKPYLAPGETLPPRQAELPVIAIAPFALKESAGVFANMPRAHIKDLSPKPIEQYDISRGLVAYRVTLPAGPPACWKRPRCATWPGCWSTANEVGTMDTRHRRFRVDLPARSKPVTHRHPAVHDRAREFRRRDPRPQGPAWTGDLQGQGRRSAAGGKLGNPRHRLRRRRRAAALWPGRPAAPRARPSGAAVSTLPAAATPSSTCHPGGRAWCGSTAAAWAATGASARPRPCTCRARGSRRASTRSWYST
jgi:beta-galactosidase